MQEKKIPNPKNKQLNFCRMKGILIPQEAREKIPVNEKRRKY